MLDAFYNDEDFRKPQTLSGCKPTLDVFYNDEDFRMPQTLSGCRSNDNQRCSDGLIDLSKHGPQTLQTLSGCTAHTYARKVRVIIVWLLFWLLGLLTVLLDALLHEARARFCGRNDWLLLPRAGIESRLLARRSSGDWHRPWVFCSRARCFCPARDVLR